MKYFLKKRGGSRKETLKSRFKRVNKFYEKVNDYVEETEEEEFDYDHFDELMTNLRNQINLLYELAVDKENEKKIEMKNLKSNYDKLVAELILIKKKKPDFVSENISKFLG